VNAIVELALKARTMADVEALEAKLQAAGATTTRYLGDREANFSALSNSADPKMLIFERLTNAFDALIELEVRRQQPNISALTGPHLAAQVLHGMPKDDLNPKGSKERELAQLIAMEFVDSDDSARRPTIAVRDYGIGISNGEAPYTILSLEESNKLRKPYTHGVFGKGGSLASMFSDATVYVLRKQPDVLSPGERDLVTVAVVRAVDLPDYGLPFLRYLVVPCAEDHRGLPWSCPASDTGFKPGVYVAHINYHAGRIGQQTWNQEESVYAYAETLLFRPTFPYTLRDGRSGAAKRRPDGREDAVLGGLSARLERISVPDDAISDRSGVASLTVQDVGPVKLRWHLFTTLDKRRSYVAKGNVVIFTHDGQVHHVWDQQRFNGMVPARSRVATRIFVEVQTEDVPRKVCRQVFTSFRNELRKVPQAAALEAAVAEWLTHDPDLREIEDKLTKEALRASAEKLSAGFLDRLNRAIAAKIPLPGLGFGGQGTGTAARPPKPIPELHAEPTYFTAPECVTVVVGEPRTFYGSINAVDGFVPSRGSVELDSGAGTDALTLSVGDLRRGRLQLRLDAKVGAAVTELRVPLLLSWLRLSGGIGRLHWPLRVRILSDPPEINPGKGHTGRTREDRRKRSRFALIWSRHDDQRDRCWTEETAGDLQLLTGAVLAERYPDQYGELREIEVAIPTIVLNKQFSPWHAYLQGARATDAAMQARQERYGIAVGVAIAQLWAAEDRIEKARLEHEAHPNGGEEPLRPMDEAQRRRAASEAARGVLALLPDFDRLTTELRAPVASEA